MKSKMSFIYEVSFVNTLPLSLKKQMIVALSFLVSNYYDLPLRRHTEGILILYLLSLLILITAMYCTCIFFIIKNFI